MINIASTEHRLKIQTFSFCQAQCKSYLLTLLMQTTTARSAEKQLCNSDILSGKHLFLLLSAKSQPENAAISIKVESKAYKT